MELCGAALGGNATRFYWSNLVQCLYQVTDKCWGVSIFPLPSGTSVLFRSAPSYETITTTVRVLCQELLDHTRTFIWMQMLQRISWVSR